MVKEISNEYVGLKSFKIILIKYFVKIKKGAGNEFNKYGCSIIKRQ